MDAATLLLVLAGAALVVGLHPFVTYPLSLRVLQRVSKTVVPEPAEPTTAVALVCCAHNEAAVIDAKIANIRALRRGGLVREAYIYADACDDDTVARLRRHPDVVTVIEGQGRHGKSAGMNRLLARVSAPLVMFTDANVMIDPTAPAVAVRRFAAEPDLGCLGGRIDCVNGADSPTAASSSLYARLEETIKTLEDNTGSAMGADGGLFVIRRDLWQAVPPDIIDDMFTSLSILCDGWRVGRDPTLHATEETRPGARDEFRRKIRIGCQAINCHRLLWPRLRRLSARDLYKYVSHKLLRWFSAFFLGAAGLLVAAWAVAAQQPEVLAALVAGVALLAVAAWVRVPVLSAVAQAALGLIGTAAGVLRAVHGERFQVWNEAKRSHK